MHIHIHMHTMYIRTYLLILCLSSHAVVWDEKNLEKNENERVPRMKIDEADTPFNRLVYDVDGMNVCMYVCMTLHFITSVLCVWCCC